MYHDKQALCAAYNGELRSKGRTDVEWRVSTSGDLYLADREDYTERKTRWINAMAERDQRRFIDAQRKADDAA